MKELDDYILAIADLRKAESAAEYLADKNIYADEQHAARKAFRDAENKHKEANIAFFELIDSASNQKNEALKSETYSLIHRIAKSCANNHIDYTTHIKEAELQSYSAGIALGQKTKDYALALEIIAETTTLNRQKNELL